MNDPRLLAIATVVLWSFFTPFVKLISVKSQFLFVNLCFALTALTFFIPLFAARGRALFRSLAGMNRWYLFFGLFGYFVYWMGLNQCFREFSSASGSTVLNYTWPIFTVFFTELIFRRSRKTFLQRVVEIAGVTLGFAAVYVLASGGKVTAFDFTHFAGLLWGLLAGAAYGFFSAYSSTVPKEAQGLFLLTSAAVSFLAMLPFGLTEIDLIAEMRWTDWGAVFLIGAVFDGGGYFLWTAANRAARDRGVDISAVGSIVFFLPFFSVILISIFYKETELLQPYFAAVMVLLIAGSFLCQRTRSIAERLRKIFSP
jgi:drug/metabolite transporter (DMT)-like permease